MSKYSFNLFALSSLLNSRFMSLCLLYIYLRENSNKLARSVLSSSFNFNIISFLDSNMLLIFSYLVLLSIKTVPCLVF